MDETSSNPLLDFRFRLPFHRIDAAHVAPAVTTLIDAAREAVRTIGERGGHSYEDTLEALEDATERLDEVITVVGHLESVASTPSLREVYNRVKPEVSAFFSSIPLDDALWKALKRYSSTAEAKRLTGTKARFLKKTVDEFRRSGADLEPAQKKRLEAINRELAELTNRFAQNVLDATSDFELIVEDESMLKGLPASARDAARDLAEKKRVSGWRFTLQATSVIPVLTYLDDAALREKIFRAYHARAAEGERANPPLIVSILRLRAELAKILGFDNFADFILEDRMAKDGATAKAFVRDLAERTRPFFEQENAALNAFRRSIEGPNAPAIRPWDLLYYAEKQRMVRFDFDEEALRPYFPVHQVLRGLFEMARRLYGVEVREASGFPVWHPEVSVFEVVDIDGTVIGAFYADLYPREEKRGGAWMNAFIVGGPAGGGEAFRPHLGFIAANVTRPLQDKPALLTHDEVSTLFHEFGHLLHQLLSRVDVRALAGTNVAWDFVELPSQIMENWCWEREALDFFARHYETGEAIPSALFEKMTRARTYREANAMMRQLGFASVDLALHTEYDPLRDGDVTAYARKKMQAFSAVQYAEDYAFIASFSHLFASTVGYAAGYYSYKWAEVLDADAFGRFKKEGVFARDVGEAFRRAVLERGDSEPPMDLFVRFMGREPSLDALLERSGLEVSPS
ncbi:MAG: M3 family metallopeptidase [Deltaproteobacteria bacterium]|nr:M3 family metallopeptidase [Deltaproteobacteria bacterium]